LHSHHGCELCIGQPPDEIIDDLPYWRCGAVKLIPQQLPEINAADYPNRERDPIPLTCEWPGCMVSVAGKKKWCEKHRLVKRHEQSELWNRKRAERKRNERGI
jgi:hypothetical protein